MCVSENTVLKNTEYTEAFDVEVHDNQRVRGGAREKWHWRDKKMKGGKYSETDKEK